MDTAKEYDYKRHILYKNGLYKTDIITIYHNDLKYKTHNNIDLMKIVNAKEKIDDHDKLEYRFEDCRRNGYVTLDISHLDLKSLPNIPSDIAKKIQYLFMSNNKIEIMDDLSHMENVVVADLCSNKLVNVPKLPDGIEELIVRNNMLTNINQLADYNYLKRLDCSYNKIASIPIIDSLEMLVTRDNSLVEIIKLKNLKKLACQNNQITRLNELPNLEILECDRNNITEIRDMKNLKQLYCSKNRISILDNLNKIEVIHCNGNKINKIDYFDTLKELMCDYYKDIDLAKFYTIENADVYKNNVMVINFK